MKANYMIAQYLYPILFHHLDRYNHVNNSVYLTLLEDAALRLFTDLGYGPEWAKSQGKVWRISKATVSYKNPTLYGDHLQVNVQIASKNASDCLCSYTINNSNDGREILTSHVVWRYEDIATEGSEPLPASLIPNTESSISAPRVRLRNADPILKPFKYSRYRQVQRYELNPTGHVKPTHFLNWIEDAYFAATTSVGFSDQNTLAEGFVVVQGGHELEIYHSATENEQIEVTSWLSEMGNARGAWMHEIHNSQGLLIAADYNLGYFVNLELRPIKAPQHALDRVINGPST
jgi:YbgC/YbaW family acyl-CoA thioester hydrolase